MGGRRGGTAAACSVAPVGVILARLFRGSWSGNWNGAVFNSSLGVVMTDSELPVLKDSKLHVSKVDLEDSSTRSNYVKASTPLSDSKPDIILPTYPTQAHSVHSPNLQQPARLPPAPSRCVVLSCACAVNTYLPSPAPLFLSSRPRHPGRLIGAEGCAENEGAEGYC
jgi:hypothetical protein